MHKQLRLLGIRPLFPGLQKAPLSELQPALGDRSAHSVTMTTPVPRPSGCTHFI